MYIYAFIIHRLTNPLIFSVNKLLKSRNSIIIIHIDAKTNSSEVCNIKNTLGEYENLIYVNELDRVNVIWGHISQINVTLLLLKYASKFDYHYFNLLSGDDIPITSNKYRELFFDESYSTGTEYISCEKNFKYLNRVKIKFTSSFYNKNKSFKEKLACKIILPYLKIFRKQNLESLPTLFFGTSWFTITDKAVDYILDFCVMNPKYIQAFENSLCGDEIFFQSIMANSHFSDRINKILENSDLSNKAVRYIDWHSGPDYPKIFNSEDFAKIINSKMLFARKFQSDISLDELGAFDKD